jgi:poly(3-hydroxybutyrate) depolymerase
MASAALYTDTSPSNCTHKRAILESHGDEDATIPYHPTENGAGGPLPDISEWVSWWGDRTCGDDAKAKYSGDLGGYNTTSYSCGEYGNVVQHYQIFDLGHCWPSSTSDNYDATVSGQGTRKCLDRALDYTPVVLDFFGRWNMGNKP